MNHIPVWWFGTVMLRGSDHNQFYVRWYGRGWCPISHGDALRLIQGQ
jgi:hypothetical protein